jgi:hypothetical protein
MQLCYGFFLTHRPTSKFYVPCAFRVRSRSPRALRLSCRGVILQISPSV